MPPKATKVAKPKAGGSSARRQQAAPSVGFDDCLAAAHAFADASGPAILPHFRRSIAVDNKDGAGGFDPVTAADRGAERAIAKALKARFPDHGMAGEEYGLKGEDARYRWVIDPIDGTKAFILGLPTWGTLIGLMDGRDPVLGIMDQPYTRERFWSARNASWMRMSDGRTRRIKTRDCTRLADAMLSTTTPDLFEPGEEATRFAKVKAAVRMTRYGSDCYAYCLIAAGLIDVVVEAGLKQVDIVALIPIIERAGGCVTSWTGGPAVDGGRVVASANPKLHAAALKLLAG